VYGIELGGEIKGIGFHVYRGKCIYKLFGRNLEGRSTDIQRQVANFSRIQFSGSTKENGYFGVISWSQFHHVIAPVAFHKPGGNGPENGFLGSCGIVLFQAGYFLKKDGSCLVVKIFTGYGFLIRQKSRNNLLANLLHANFLQLVGNADPVPDNNIFFYVIHPTRL
jgi:hypothetical protein